MVMASKKFENSTSCLFRNQKIKLYSTLDFDYGLSIALFSRFSHDFPRNSPQVPFAAATLRQTFKAPPGLDGEPLGKTPKGMVYGKEK